MTGSGTESLSLSPYELEVTSKLPSKVKLLEPTESKSRRKNRKRDKTNSKPALLFYGNNLQGEISEGIYLQTEEENDNISEDLFSQDEFMEDDLYYSSWKNGCQFCRSASKRVKPKVKPCRRMKLVDKNKSSKRVLNIADNSTARKANIQLKLDNAKIKRFGTGIYEKRCERSETVNKRRKVNVQKGQQDSVDHPNALKYELKPNCAAKGDGYMNKIAELQHRDITPEDFELLLMLDESVAPKTVSTSFLTTLTVVIVSDANLLGELCSICMEVYQACEKAKRLPCNHLFHVNCIDNWLSNASPNCPLDGVPVEA